MRCSSLSASEFTEYFLLFTGIEKKTAIFNNKKRQCFEIFRILIFQGTFDCIFLLKDKSLGAFLFAFDIEHLVKNEEISLQI